MIERPVPHCIFSVLLCSTVIIGRPIKLDVSGKGEPEQGTPASVCPGGRSSIVQEIRLFVVRLLRWITLLHFATALESFSLLGFALLHHLGVLLCRQHALQLKVALLA